jgi:hypothetical protein
MFTLKDALLENSEGASREILTELVGSFPESEILPADIVDGYEYESLVEIKRAGVKFYDRGGSLPISNDELELRKFQMYNLGGISGGPVSTLETIKGGYGKWLERQEQSKVKSAVELMGKGFYYGQTTQVLTDQTGASIDLKKCFPGIIKGMTSAMEIDATGSSAQTSVYALRITSSGIRMKMGGGVGIGMPKEYQMQFVPGATSGELIQMVLGLVRCYPGLEVLVSHNRARIKNLSSAGASGKTLTAGMMDRLEALAPAGLPWTHYFMTKASRAQLQADKQSKVLGGASYMPPPTEHNGIPIIVTDSISNAESV